MLKNKMVIRFNLLMLSMTICTAAAPSFAAPVPDSGQLLNQQQQQMNLNNMQHLPQAEEEKDHLVVTDKRGTKILVKGFHFTGNKGVASDAELEKVVAGSIGQKLNFQQLQGVADSVSDYLKKKGWPLVRAYLPKQDVTEGNIEITIVQGHVESKGATVITEGTRISSERLKAIVDAALPYGPQPASSEDLERGVLLINDMPGMSAHATLERGSEPDSTHLVVNAKEGPWVTGGVSVDDYGNRYTGPVEFLPSASLNDPLGIGDQLTVSGTRSENSGIELYQVGYSLPVGSSGARLAATYSNLAYDINQELGGVDANGMARTAGATLTYPFLRTRKTSVWGGLGYAYRTLEDDVSSLRISDRTVNDGLANFVITNNDDLGGGGITTAMIAGTYGNLDRSGVASDLASDRSTARSNGSFTKMTYSVARLQHVAEDFSMFCAIRGQMAEKNLDSSEKFILGGPAGIRAYPVGEGTGDEGWLGNVEIRYDIPGKTPVGKVQLITFVDAGGITLNRNNWAGGVNTSTGDNDYTLAGAGVGANIDLNDKYTIRTSWAAALGHNEGRGLDGDNSDGLSRNNQLWIQAIASF